jgi:hypothetical protein
VGLAWSLALLPAPARGQAGGGAAALPEESRQFDFWLGEWDVNLRIRQEDLSWQDAVQARAKIYSILGGKAVLELWDGGVIKGFSLRYVDPAMGKWVLWLNWPGQNRAGSSSLEGSFRHGRGEFFATQTNADGTETLSRYTFSDVTPTSLRWDDAFSSDGGRTWTNRWIMEFTRTAGPPELPPEGGEAHTWVSGNRCTLEGFRSFEGLVGRHGGAGDGDGAMLTGYRVLDGCAVLALLSFEEEGRRREVFAHLTWNTFASRPELLLLDDHPSSAARLYYGGEDGALVFYPRGEGEGSVERVRVEVGQDGGWRWVWEGREGVGGEWGVVRGVGVGG